MAYFKPRCFYHGWALTLSAPLTVLWSCTRLNQRVAVAVKQAGSCSSHPAIGKQGPEPSQTAENLAQEKLSCLCGSLYSLLGMRRETIQTQVFFVVRRRFIPSTGRKEEKPQASTGPEMRLIRGYKKISLINMPSAFWEVVRKRDEN